MDAILDDELTKLANLKRRETESEVRVQHDRAQFAAAYALTRPIDDPIWTPTLEALFAHGRAARLASVTCCDD